MPRPHWHVQLRIVRELPFTIEGFDTSRFQLGSVYDVNAPLCDLLITLGYAVPEADTSPGDQGAARSAPAAKPPPTRKAAADETRRTRPRRKKPRHR